MPYVDPDNSDPRLIAQLVATYEKSADRLREIVLNPNGKTDRAREFNQSQAAARLSQVNAEIARLKQIAAKWSSQALSTAVKTGVERADKQAVEAGIRQTDGLHGAFNVMDRKAAEILAQDTVGDLTKAAESMAGNAGTLLRRMAATGVTNEQVNQILAGRHVIEGQPDAAVRDLREALKKVHGKTVTIQTKRGPMEFQAGYYARMVATTKTREAVCKARHARLQEQGLDLVTVIGKQSANFCTAYLGKVFSISGTHPKYPALSSLPGGGPPFHPNCSKSTAPFVEELATEAQIDAAEPNDQTQTMLGTNNTTDLQKRFKAQGMQQDAQQRVRDIANSIKGSE